MSTKEKDTAANAPTGDITPARKKLATWVGGKFKASQEKVKAAATTDEQVGILNDYFIVFNGVQEALEAMDTSAEVLSPVTKVLSLIDADLSAAEKRMELEAELGL